MNNSTVISLVYNNEIKFILYFALKVTVIQTLFNISTTNVYLKDFNDIYYFPTPQGEFLYLRQSILAIQPAPTKSKLEVLVINKTDSRTIDSINDYVASDIISTGYSVPGGNMRRSYIKFGNIASLNGKVIARAFLHVVGKMRDKDYYFADPKEVFVHRITQNFTTPTKYAMMPIYKSEPESSILIDETREISFYWDITFLVKEWVDGVSYNYGLLLRSEDVYGVESAKIYYSNTKPPQLIVSYLAKN